MHPGRDSILVTGSGGLIGRAVCERLARSFAVIGFDRAGPPHPVAHVHGLVADLADGDSVLAACAQVHRLCAGRLAGVIHLAGHHDPSGDPSPRYEQVNVLGTRRLLRGLRGFSIGQFIYSSSMLVHAPTVPGVPLDEDSPLRPAWDLPRSKIEAEALLRHECGPTPLVILRLACVYDDGCHAQPLAHQIQRIHQRTVTSRVFPGQPAHGQAHVHRDDVVEAVRLALERRAVLPPVTTLLIGEPETIGYAELQRTIGRELHGEEWETRAIAKVMARVGAWMQEDLPLGEDPFVKPWMVELADEHYELDVGRACRELGWEPRQRLRRALPRMLAALRADPGAWYRDNRSTVPLHAAFGA